MFRAKIEASERHEKRFSDGRAQPIFDAKIAQASAMRRDSQMAERSLSYAKIEQASAMRRDSQMAERSLSYAKIINSDNKVLPPANNKNRLSHNLPTKHKIYRRNAVCANTNP
jgi:hypothetical protein